MLQAESSTSILVSWKEPALQNGEITNYIIYYRQQDGPGTEAQVTGSTFQRLLTNLTKFTTYYIKVRGKITELGNASRLLNATTFEDLPSSDPVIVKGQDGTKAEDAHTIRVVWEEMPEKDQNGILTGYTVFYNETGQSQYFSKNATASQTSALIGGLKPFTKYCIKVAGYTKVGRSPLTDPCYVVETLQKGPSHPRDVMLQANSSTSILVAWKEPALQNGEITNYIIYYRQQDDPETEAQVTGSTFQRLLTDLTKFTTYYIKVRGKTTELGNASRLLNATTFEDLPGKPTEVKATLDDGNINVTWEEPIDPNGIILKYQIYCVGKREYDGAFQSNLEIPTTEDVRFNVIKKADLIPGTEFTVYITAFTSKGEGSQSEHMVVNKPAVAPPPPTEPHVNKEATTSHTITITIQPANDTNGKVIFHQVIVKIPAKVTKREIPIIPDDVTNYKEVTRKVEKLYIAARLSRDALNTSKVFVLGDGKTYGGYENVQLEPGTRYKVYIRGVTQSNARFLYGLPTEISLPPTLEDNPPSGLKTDADDTVGILAGSLAALVLIVIIGILLYKRNNRGRNPNLDVESHKRKRRDFKLKRQTAARSGDAEEELEMELLNVAVNKWEVPLGQISLEEVIGSGAFGTVWRATLSRGNGKRGIRFVAAKCFSPTSGQEGKTALMREIGLGKVIGDSPQPNIVQFIGCVTTQIHPILIMEYLPRGDLLGYLRKSRGIFDKYYRGKLQVAQLGTYDLMSFSNQIATGMVFLASRGIIHRDLAARNVLLDKNRVCKITDFGLSYQNFKYGHGNAKKGCIPVKWTAPEILFGDAANLSSKSDVWSYGVVLYEIFTIGIT
ncbi:insulin-like peptide receptor [Montipora capricornis]|uniref:insulin-like peptide receptor n=1 Tax=Montipora capricornis TaxID=246305 RepID=UPI0035F1E3F7